MKRERERDMVGVVEGGVSRAEERKRSEQRGGRMEYECSLE